MIRKTKNRKSVPTQYYFAYGSNLRHSQMKKRCPHMQYVGRGYIAGWQLVFAGFSMRWNGGTATIQPSPGHKLWGAIYQLDADCIKKLNRFEGQFLHFYHHKIFECSLEDGSKIQAYTYIKNKEKMKIRQPSSKYMKQIIRGANESHLPAHYIDYLEKIPLYRPNTARSARLPADQF